MNIRRGLFRVWVVASAAWLVVDSSAKNLPCKLSHYSLPWCNGWDQFLPVDASQPNDIPETNIHACVVLFGIPLLSLLVGAALLWAAAGFERERTRSN